ncbi:hypothetical protein GC177_06935 [bacterium]|nr:hypothetical protein [bacterium]
MPTFIVIGHDAMDAEAPARRQANRDAHLAVAEANKKSGNLLFAAALVDEQGIMRGSVMTVNYPDRASLDAWLYKDPYVTGNVWEHVDIQTCKLAPMFADLAPAA